MHFRNLIGFSKVAQVLRAFGLYALPCLLFRSNSAFADWSTDPNINNPICTAADNQRNVQVIPDSSGGAITVWQDFRNGPAFFGQRISGDGAIQWATDGTTICTALFPYAYADVISDGAGGAIIAWGDTRNGTDINIFAQHIDSSGTAQWADNGVTVCAAPGSQHHPQLISDGAGGAIISWHDSRTTATNDDIYAQHINSNGAVQWTPTGVAICTASRDQFGPQLASDGAGGAIVVWEDFRNGPLDIYAQRVNSLGLVQWTADGVGICTATNNQTAPHVISDDAGGAIIVWDDGRNGATNYDIYAQHIDVNGAVLWQEDGIAICAASDNQSHSQVSNDGRGGGIITWEDHRSSLDWDIYAQHVNTSGTVLWTTDGVAICTAPNDSLYHNSFQIDGQPASDGAGGAIIAWQDFRNGSDNNIYAQRIDSNGVVQWPNNGAKISTAVNDQQFPQLTYDGCGGAFIAWEDSRITDTLADIYASHVTSNGVLGETTATQLADVMFPADIHGWTQFGTTGASQSVGYDSENQALIAHVASVPEDNDYRIVGWLSAVSDTVYYASVGSGNFLRAKFYVYAGGQSGTALNEIPNFRARIASRFAYSAILQLYNHDNSDPEGTALAEDVRPSTSPLTPSIYRVDLDPPDVPQLVNNPNTEGFLRLFEAYEGDHQANGDLGLVESTIGVYPALTSFDNTSTVSVTQNGLIKSYTPGASDGGDFGNNIAVATPGIVNTTNGAITIIKNFHGSAETTGPMPSVTINSAGVTMDTLSVETDRYGACALDTFGDIPDQTNHAVRARIDPGKQYRIRFHATSTKQSNTQPLMRFRIRTLKYLYTSNLEVGSSQALPPTSTANATIAAQALPGIGNQMPPFDRIDPTENGGWYNVLMVSPMNPDIQPDQPNLYAQDGPGVDTSPVSNSKSRRDIQFGFDIIDTFSTQPNSGIEAGQMTVDRVDIEKYDLVPD